MWSRTRSAGSKVPAPHRSFPVQGGAADVEPELHSRRSDPRDPALLSRPRRDAALESRQRVTRMPAHLTTECGCQHNQHCSFRHLVHLPSRMGSSRLPCGNRRRLHRWAPCLRSDSRVSHRGRRSSGSHRHVRVLYSTSRPSCPRVELALHCRSECPPGARQAGHDGSDGQVHHRGELAVRLTLELAEREQLAERGGSLLMARSINAASSVWSRSVSGSDPGRSVLCCSSSNGSVAA